MEPTNKEISVRIDQADVWVLLVGNAELTADALLLGSLEELGLKGPEQ